jgi:hypothetical protein
LLLQIAIATLTALGTLLLGMGERQMTLPLMAVIVSASSVYLTDVSGWFRLNPKVANIAGSTAVVIFVWDFLNRFGEETQLLAVANLLIYLQFVLLYQKKSDSTYWLLALLSLLQVAVATALNFELVFGLLLFVYLVCGLAAMGLFFLHRELGPFERHQQRCLAGKFAASQQASRRWPWSTGGPAVHVRWRHSELQEVLGWRFVRQVSGLTGVTIGFALLFFFAVPRVGQNPWPGAMTSSQSVAGASNQVVLGETGPIAENPEVVMRTAFFRADTNTYYPLKEAPLFRGPVLSQYADGTWTEGEVKPIHPAPAAALPNEKVRQVIWTRSSNTGSVYCVAPVVEIEDRGDKRLNFNSATQQVTREYKNRDQTIEIYTTGLSNGRQMSLIPNTVDQDSLAELTECSDKRLANLRNLADALVSETDPGDALTRSRILCNHLHDSGLYEYTLFAPERDAELDPVEDFLFKHQRGHCEYFASALALMLRSVGIPSRVVLGFNGGEYNGVGGFYQVRQLHAHAWVEAYLTSDQLPGELRGKKPWQYGAWLTLDPTPGTSGAASRIGTTAGLPSFRQVADYARYLWSSYIMGLDSDRQLRMIYEPVAAGLVRGWQRLLEHIGWHALIDRITAPFGIDDPRVAPVAALVALVALMATALIGLSRLARRLRGPRKRAPKTLRVVVEFYERLESLLAELGLVRPETLTQCEFAQAAADGLTARGLPPSVASVPIRVTDAFYRVRFGRRHLDKHQLHAVEQALTLLEQASRRQR